MHFKIAEQRYNSIISRNSSVKEYLKKEAFYKFYKEDSFNRECEYCGITEKDIDKLIREGNINTKRLTSRGRTMEVDRKDGHGEYSLDNIVLSCYWCNNAKTDEFTYDEFKEIAPHIKKAFKTRKKTDTKSDLKGYRLQTDWDSVSNLYLAFPENMYSISNQEKTQRVLFNLIEKIDKNHQNLNIYLLYKESGKVYKAIKKISEERKKIVTLTANPYLDDVWVRDFMPLVLQKENEKDKLFTKCIYYPLYFKEYRKYSLESNRSALYILESNKLTYNYLSKSGSGFWYEGIDDDYLANSSVEKRAIILDGGNIIHNGEIAFISARVLVENIENIGKIFKEYDTKSLKNELKKDSIKALISTIEERLNLKKLYILPTEKDETTGHLDGTLRFLSKEKLIIDVDYFKEYEKYLEEIFNEQNFEKEVIKQKLLNEESAKGILLNYLRIENSCYVPKYEENNNYLKEFKKILVENGLTVVEIEEDGSYSDKGGVFNCISWTY